jgi:hypothetical protein
MGFLVDRTMKVREPSLPDSRLYRAVEANAWRYDDDLIEVFHRARGAKDLIEATEVLTLLEKWHVRRNYRDEHERQKRATGLKRMRAELDRDHLARGTRPVQSVAVAAR